MAIKVTLDRKLVVNGKDFKSIDELPENVRQVCENAISSGTSGHGNFVKTDIIFNGKHYTDIDAMPQEARDFYRQALQAAGLHQPGDGFVGGKQVHLGGDGNAGSRLKFNVSTTAIVPGSQLPKGMGWAIAGGLVLVLLLIARMFLL
jgi:hypothetical protein